MLTKGGERSQARTRDSSTGDVARIWVTVRSGSHQAVPHKSPLEPQEPPEPGCACSLDSASHVHFPSEFRKIQTEEQTPQTQGTSRGSSGPKRQTALVAAVSVWAT